MQPNSAKNIMFIMRFRVTYGIKKFAISSKSKLPKSWFENLESAYVYAICPCFLLRSIISASETVQIYEIA